MPAPAASSPNSAPQSLLNHGRIREIGKYQPVPPEAIGADTALQLYRQMKRLRRTEEGLFNEYHPADEMRCPIHFCIGQEAIPAALSLLVQADDFMFSHHRSHGYYFAKGSPLRELFAEIYGRETGASGGKAGSQDISHHETKFYSGAILAGALSIAAGTAFGLKHQGLPQIAISGCGEGATDEGAFWEAVNYAGRMKLPLLIVIENNRYATFSDQLKRQAQDNICERVRPFGMRATKIFGNDAVLAWQTLQAEIARVRAGDGPALVEAYTFRWNSHVGPEDDSFNGYRTNEEMQFWKNNCPITLLEDGLRRIGALSDAQLKLIEEEVAAEIAANFKFAKESPFPSDTSWRRMNWDESSPLADKLLGTAASRTDFDHDQAEAKLGPY
jgi:TPP-dependent pyruvate/acetoin dehydrogenase alpha subunit